MRIEEGGGIRARDIIEGYCFNPPSCIFETQIIKIRVPAIQELVGENAMLL